MVIDKFVLDLSFTAISSNSSSFAATSSNAQGLPSFLSFGFYKLPDSIMGSQPEKFFILPLPHLRNPAVGKSVLENF